MKAPARIWLAGARPRTLSAALSPVMVGSALGWAHGRLVAWRVVACFVVAMAIQVGTNYANDYSDGIRGTDANRAGPARLVGGGLATPQAVRRAAWTCFAVAGVAGAALAIAVDPLLLLVGVACVAAAWLYTGGPRPYGYAGLGELSVFVFFGLVATVGSAYVQTKHVSELEVVSAIPVGLLAVAILVANNLRDIPGDVAAGKRTLAVRLGDARTRALYVGCVICAMAAGASLYAQRPWALLCLVALPLAVAPVRGVLCGARGRDLVAVLVATSRLLLVFSAVLAVGIAL